MRLRGHYARYRVSGERGYDEGVGVYEIVFLDKQHEASVECRVSL